MRTIITILILACLVSCQRDPSSDCLENYGSVSEERLELPVFIQLDIHDIFNIFLMQDTINELVIKTGDNLQDEIEVTLSEKTLHIYNHSKCRWLRKYDRAELNLRFRNLYGLRVWEPCKVVTLKPITKTYFTIYSFSKLFEGDIELNNKYFKYGVNYSCTGSTKISGQTRSLTLMNRGVHHIMADSLISSFADITNDSRGDIWAGTTDTLSVHILLSGNVYYRGDPVIMTSEITSTGRLIRLEN